jgi:hypothetical protein
VHFEKSSETCHNPDSHTVELLAGVLELVEVVVLVLLPSSAADVVVFLEESIGSSEELGR